MQQAIKSLLVFFASFVPAVQARHFFVELVNGETDFDLSIAGIDFCFELALKLFDRIKRIPNFTCFFLSFLPTSSLCTDCLILAIAVNVEPFHTTAARPIGPITLRAAW
jgi:hypothetical protein